MTSHRAADRSPVPARPDPASAGEYQPAGSLFYLIEEPKTSPLTTKVAIFFELKEFVSCMLGMRSRQLWL